jgi:hypothetical protein
VARIAPRRASAARRKSICTATSARFAFRIVRLRAIAVASGLGTQEYHMCTKAIVATAMVVPGLMAPPFDGGH